MLRWNSVLEWILGNRVGRRELNAFGLDWGPVAGSCEHCTEPSVCKKRWEFLD